MPVHPTAILHPGAEVHESVDIGPFCVIDEHVRIAAGCRIMHGAYLTGWTDIGENCIFHPNTIVGHTPQDLKHKGDRSFCRVGSGTVLREYATIHRGSAPDSETALGEGCLLHVGAHVGHNARVGDRVTLGEHALLAGHSEVGHDVTMGAAAGLHQFTRIGEWAQIDASVTIRQHIVPFACVPADDRIGGINEAALDRFTQAEASDVRALFEVFLSGHRAFGQTRRRLADAAETVPGRRFVEFLSVDTTRGYAGGTTGISGDSLNS